MTTTRLVLHPGCQVARNGGTRKLEHLIDEPCSAELDKPSSGEPLRHAIDDPAGGAGLRVLVVIGHPRRKSLCEALAHAYAEGAGAAAVGIRILHLADLAFEPDVVTPSPRQQASEPDLVAARASIAWADHLVFVFPTWWGSMPGLLKGFLDRVLLPGFAFDEREDGGFDPLLKGKSGHLVTTMDTPLWVYRWIYGSPGLNAMARATLGFCGIKPVRRTAFGPVKGSTPAERQGWLEAVRREGLALRQGVLRPHQRRLATAAAWVAALRLQFYPTTWATYVLGAMAATSMGYPGDPAAFWLGLLAIFTLEAATVLTNEWFDLESDRRNRNAGPFNGGSRVLVDGRLSKDQFRRGIVGVLAAFGVTASVVAAIGPTAATLVLVVFTLLALGYTVPPLRLSWRTLGELDVALTHSLLALLYGWALQDGRLTEPYPYLIGLPLFLGILPSIILANIPDLPADAAVGKRTLAVRFGPMPAARMAGLAAIAAWLASLLWLPLLGWPALIGSALAGAHAIWLLRKLEAYRRSRPKPGRIDGLIIAGLTYMIWFVAVPLVALAG